MFTDVGKSGIFLYSFPKTDPDGYSTDEGRNKEEYEVFARNSRLRRTQGNMMTSLINW